MISIIYGSFPNFSRCRLQLFSNGFFVFWIATLVAVATYPTKGIMMKEWVAVLRAADAAARWHIHQRRKGSAQEPYINHLLEVAGLVAAATEGREPVAVIAALLHD